MIAALRELRASHPGNVLQTYPEHEILSRRSLGGPKSSENYEHRRPKSFTVYSNAGLKAAEVWKCRSPSEITTLRGIGVACTLSPKTTLT
ncbi:hypothetical protein NPIL_444791 [Nephila pilipes]|uniref:Uncharacterized protein n=1 Tax=Nephila pilipes TaxID=299642 RepID=A0A8X6ULU1_NEPPI|nr:hypothetical protein NPIL_615531 [Nephila pilipes]GFU27303.1 hypothetical protein NPIL_444791 [Nephila pilipes]